MKKVDEFHLADPNDIEKTKKQIFKINKNRNLIGFHKELHKETDMTAIGLWLMGAKAYYLQPYKESEQVIQPGFHPHDAATLESFVHILSAFIPKVEIRGFDS